MKKEEIIKSFLDIYTSSGLGQQADWAGVHTQKCPLDAWIFQEIIWDTEPDIIIECGTADGGMALFMAMILDRMRKGKIITIESNDKLEKPAHSRIKYIRGSTVDLKTVEQVKKEIKKDDKVMVILDSDHFKDHVYNEIVLYHKFVTLGQYLIVEDTFWVSDSDNKGPADAVKEFLDNYSNIFEIDRNREKFLCTYNPGGYLKRIK